MRLGQNFNNKVLGGRRIHQVLCSTTTGTGFNATGYKVGVCCLDRSSANWFICTASAGTGTWLKINA